MWLLRSSFSSNERPWQWFFSVVVGGSLPLIVTFFVEIDSETGNYLKMADVVFLGLAFNVSNLTLVGDRKNFDRKPFVVGFSYTFLILLAFCLGRIYSKPDSTLEFKWITGGLVLISAYVSFEANHFVMKHAKRR